MLKGAPVRLITYISPCHCNIYANDAPTQWRNEKLQDSFLLGFELLLICINFEFGEITKWILLFKSVVSLDRIGHAPQEAEMEWQEEEFVYLFYLFQIQQGRFVTKKIMNYIINYAIMPT